MPTSPTSGVNWPDFVGLKDPPMTRFPQHQYPQQEANDPTFPLATTSLCPRRIQLLQDSHLSLHLQGQSLS